MVTFKSFFYRFVSLQYLLFSWPLPTAQNREISCVGSLLSKARNRHMGQNRAGDFKLLQGGAPVVDANEKRAPPQTR